MFSPRDLRFAGSNSIEADCFFQWRNFKQSVKKLKSKKEASEQKYVFDIIVPPYVAPEASGSN